MTTGLPIHPAYLRNLTRFFGVYLLASLLLAGALALGIFQDATGKLRMAQHDGRAAMAAVAQALELEINGLRHDIHLFVVKNQAMLDDLYHQRDLDNRLFELADEVALWFPHAIAYTVADAEGWPVLADFGGNIGPVCLDDLRKSARDNRPLVPLHGVDSVPHIDVVAPLRFGAGEGGAFLVSFSAHALAALLQANSDSRFTLSYDNGEGLQAGAPGLPVEGSDIRLSNRIKPEYRQAVAAERGRRLLLYLGCFLAFASLGASILWRSRTRILSETREILRLNRELEELSLKDPLTGLCNRRSLHLRLGPILAQADRDNKTLALALLDLDHFKRINDQQGHEMGDTCLSQFGRLLMGFSRRPLDLAVRYGGEEFVLCWFDTEAEGAENMAQQLLQQTRDLPQRHANGSPMTVSIGLACRSPGAETGWEALLREADQAMYQAKQQGRDRLHWA